MLTTRSFLPSFSNNLTKRSLSISKKPSYHSRFLYDRHFPKTVPLNDQVKKHIVVNEMRSFFLRRNFIEVDGQSRLSILRICDDPSNQRFMDWGGKRWPFTQTNQMWLEEDLLSNPSYEGVFCITTSYRDEKNPIKGRHNLAGVFGMFEVESRGNMNDMLDLQKEMLLHLGFRNEHFSEVEYDAVAKKYRCEDIGAKEENKMYYDYNAATFLKNFPLYTDPFWNMKLFKDHGVKKVKKTDVIIGGQETIGSAERSCDVKEMRKQFFKVAKGGYATKLFTMFGKERVLAELEKYLSHDFTPRFGWGTGTDRLIKGMEKEGIFPYSDH